MKKIAIVTMNHGYNYGNKLQNYAMKRLYEGLGFEVSTISFQPSNNDKIINKVSIIKKINNKIIKIFFKKREINRLNKFREFNTEYLNMTKKIYNNNNYKNIDTDMFDIFSVGSDQVWNSYFWDFSSFYLLDFVKEKYKKVSYAASFGVDDIKPIYKDKFKEYLSQFKSISVREQKGKDIIKSLINKDVPVVLDPTLMLNKEEWEKFSYKPKKFPNKKYIFTYFLGNVNKERKKAIIKFAKERKLELVTLNDMK